jgi:hypothetical protein
VVQHPVLREERPHQLAGDHERMKSGQR